MAIVELTKAQRGVGDIELRNSSGDRKWISGKVYSSSDTLPSGYVKYGVIYGFEKFGAAMLVAFTDSGTGKLWCTTTTSVTLPVASTSAWGRAINGTSGSYKCMNVARVKSLCKTDSNNTVTTTHPTNAYYQAGASGNQPNTEAMFLANDEAVNLYGTYDAYIAQVRPLLKGSAAGVFGLRVGKSYTKALAEDTSFSFDAAKYCYNYVVSGSGDAAGNWWLPDMYELAVMMADEHYNLHASLSGVSNSSTYWSCVPASATYAWGYSHSGMSSNNPFTYTSPRARPVTLSV